MGSHLTIKTIENLIEGNIYPEEERNFFHHWKGCPFCQSALKERFSRTWFHQPSKVSNIKGAIVAVNKDPAFFFFGDSTAVAAASFSLSDLENTINQHQTNITIEHLSIPAISIRRQIEEYFSGKPLSRITVRPTFIRTEFERHVLFWTWLVPYGCLTTYGEIASWIDNRNAARAVGGALHRNPIPVFIPCHRVVGSDGNLTGFGGGMVIKKQLLMLEGHNVEYNRIHF